MKVFGGEQQLCPCYKEWQEFQKLMELKEGLVVYFHRPSSEDIRQAEAVESAASTTRDVFILHNKKNVKITSSELKSELGTSLVDSGTTFVETPVGFKELSRPSLKDRKQEEIFEDRPSMDAKEALKRRHDLTLRQMIRPEPTSKYYVEPEIDIKIPTLKHDRGPRGTSDLDYTSNREKIIRSTRTSHHSYYEPKKADKYHHDKVKQVLYDSEPKKVKKLEDRYNVDEELKLQRSVDKINHKAKKLEQHVIKSKSEPIKTVENVVKHQYSLFFPKVMKNKEKKVKIDEVTEKGSKDLKSGTEQKDKMNEVSEKNKKTKKGKVEQEDKGVGKDQKTKPEREDSDIKLQTEKKDNENLKKQIEQLQKEKKARKAQGAKDKEELDEPSKKGKASRKTRDVSDEINVSMSKIQKSLKNETSGEQEIFKIKQGKRKETESITLKKESSMPSELSELKKLQAEHLKEKQKALKNKILIEHAAEVALAKEEARHKAKTDELKWRNTNMISQSEEILKLVKLKQAAKDGDLFPDFFLNSDKELDALALEAERKRTKDKTEIIIGEKIFKNKSRFDKIKEPEDVPILFQKKIWVESSPQFKQILQIIPQETKPEQEKNRLTKIEPGKGVLHYALSDRTFIDKGWTMLPTEKVVRKMNVYRMRPAHPEFDWFENNKNQRLMTYDTGERLAEFDDNGRGRWFYRNGRLALDYYDAEETNANQRFVIYSSGEPDERGRTHPVTILATFDYLGNGIVFDHAGKIRLKYNQTEGVVLDRGIGPISHWQWHSLNDPPDLQQVMIDTQMSLKDPKIFKLGSEKDTTTRPDNEEMLAIEFDNFIKEKSKKLSQKFKPFQIRMKALKINEYFSLKVLDQATVYLIFRDGSTNLKVNIGMKLDHREIVDTETAEVDEVLNSLERFPARTDSLAGLQRSVAHAQHYERQHAERQRWLRPPVPCASTDHLTAAASPPMRLPLITVPTGSSSSTRYISRKPTNNLYYDTRLLC